MRFSSEEVNEIKFADGSDLSIGEFTHSEEVTLPILIVAACRVKPHPYLLNQHVTLDLISQHGEWGKSNIIRLEEKVNIDDKILFQIRPGQKHPSHVSKKEPERTSLIYLEFDKINDSSYELRAAYPRSKYDPGEEPISPHIDPFCEEGRVERDLCLEKWCNYAYPYNSEVDSFTSSWKEVINEYGDEYHW
ncbi:MAG: hypothetical protein AAGF07_00220 [Patescibacteria group bacterium]